MRKTLLLLVVLSMCVLALSAGSATIVEGRPGNMEIRRAVIDEVGGTIFETASCLAWYEIIVNGNSVISNFAASEDPEARIHVTVNKNGANAFCKFTDTSGVYEANAETGYTEYCELYTEDGMWTGGEGHVTAAANNDKGDADGGNVSITCHFDAEDFTPWVR